MDISFSQIREREIINVYDGKRLGRIIDIIFDDTAGYVLGFIVPGVKKGIFKKTEDLFIPLSCVVKLGTEVILVKLDPVSQKHSSNASHQPDLMYDYYVYPEK